MELVIGFVLFVALVGCWAFLPGTISSAALAGAKDAALEQAGARVNA